MANTPSNSSQYVFGPAGSGDSLHFQDSTGAVVSWIDGNGSPQGRLASLLSGISAILYVSPAGSDSNTGQTWGAPKQSIMGAYDALPSTGGTIYITDGGTSVNAATTSDPAGCGIWIMGSTDPNFANPPVGWRKKKYVNFVGVGGDTIGGNAHSDAVIQVAAGSGSDRNKPSIWISGCAGGVTFRNLNFNYPMRPIVVGEDSNHGRVAIGGGSSSIAFYNVSANTGQSGGRSCGPVVDITGDTFWIFFENCSFSNGNITDPTTSDRLATILIDGSASDGCGYVYVRDSNLNGGGIKARGGTNGNGPFTFENITLEGDFIHSIPPAVWMTSPVGSPGGMTCIGVQLADPGPNPPAAIQIDAGNASDTFVSGSGGVQGPATVVGQADPIISPSRQTQSGFFKGHVVGSHDAARRIFTPGVARFTNLASQLSSNWTLFQGANSTFTQGIAAPDGTNNAVRATSTSSTANFIMLYQATRSVSVGDYLFYGLWYRALAAVQADPINGANVLQGSGNTVSLVTRQAINLGDGDWKWVWHLAKVTAVGTTPAPMQLDVEFDSVHGGIEAFAPVFLQIPVGTLSDNEVYDLAENLQSYCDVAAPGDVTLLRGQRLLVPRIKANLGTAYSGADAAIVLSAGWGNTAAVSAAAGFDQAFSFSVTSNGTGIAANPTITVTFKDGTWTTAPQYQVHRNDLASPFGAPPHTWVDAATTLTITFNGTPVAGNVYRFKCMAMGN